MSAFASFSSIADFDADALSYQGDAKAKRQALLLRSTRISWRR